MKGWYDPIFSLIQEEIQFQHYQLLKYLVVQMIGWVNLGEANGHMMYPKGMFIQIGGGAGGIIEMRYIHILKWVI